ARLNEADVAAKRFSSDSLVYLRDHTWPGNVRELYNTVQRAFILADQVLDLRSAAMYGPSVNGTASVEEGVAFKPGMSLSEVERIVIMETLKCFSGNKTRTA